MANAEFAVDKKGCFILLHHETLYKMRKFFKAGKDVSVSTMVEMMGDLLFGKMKLTAKENAAINAEIERNKALREERRKKWATSAAQERDSEYRKARRDARREAKSTTTAKKGVK